MENLFETLGEILKPESDRKISFKPLRSGNLAYCENDIFKTYVNIKQADKKVIELQSLGYNVYRRYQHPFFILLQTS